MKYATMAQAARWVEKPLGLSLAEAPEAVYAKVNEIRGYLYHLASDLDFAFDVAECFEAQCFCEPCHDCKGEWVGVTLPHGWQGHLSVWRNDQPLPLYNRWRGYDRYHEPEVSRSAVNRCCEYQCPSCCVRVHDAGFFSTERDISPCGSCSLLKVRADHIADAGKMVEVNYTSATGKKTTDRIALSDAWSATSTEAASLSHPSGVVLPDDLCGRVIIAQQDGRILSQYARNESVPSYMRLRMEGLKPGEQVWVRGTRDFVELDDPMDVVESGNPTAWMEMARFIKLHAKSGRSEKEERMSQSHLALARAALVGERRRERPEAERMNFAPTPYFHRSSGLLTRR